MTRTRRWAIGWHSRLSANFSLDEGTSDVLIAVRQARIDRTRRTEGCRELLKPPVPVGLHTFPSDDGAFRRFAEDEFARLGAASLDELQSALRVRYPFATVRLRSELATLGEDGPMWYAFRRGLGDPPSDRWWNQVTSWATIAADRTFVAVSEAFADILEVPSATVIGLRIEELANPGDPTATLDVSALWSQLLSRGFADGTLRFNRLDGTLREIEYHVARDSENARAYRAAIRER